MLTVYFPFSNYYLLLPSTAVSMLLICGHVTVSISISLIQTYGNSSIHPGFIILVSMHCYITFKLVSALFERVRNKNN